MRPVDLGRSRRAGDPIHPEEREVNVDLLELETAVTILQDKQAIRECLMNYSRGIDRLDRDILLSVYWPDAVDDHGVFVGAPEDFVDWAFAMHTTTHHSHQHAILNLTIDLDGDTAHTESYYMFVSLNQTGTPWSIGGGRYIDRFEKRYGEWRIADRLCIRDWAQLDEIPLPLDQSRMTAVKGLSEEVRELMRSGPQPARDTTDPSYLRPFTTDRSRVMKKGDR
jgi:ketosteroid isomerase-like protein